MARIRTIKPEYWEDEKVGALTVPARLLFIGTWNFADDFGVIRSNPALLRSQIFPYDDNLRASEVKKWLDELVKLDLLVPLQYDGDTYYIIRHFKEHQILDKRYDKSCISKDKKLVGELIAKALSNNDVNTTSTPSVYEGDTQKFDALTLKELEKQLLNDGGWQQTTIELLYRQTKILLSAEQIKDAISTFALKLDADGEHYKPLEDAKKHFINWYRIELEKQQKNEKSNKTNRRTASRTTESKSTISPAKSIEF